MVSAVKMYSHDKLDYNVPAKYFTYMKEKSELLCSKNMHPFYFAVGILSSLGSRGRWGFCRLLTPFSDLIDLLWFYSGLCYQIHRADLGRNSFQTSGVLHF